MSPGAFAKVLLILPPELRENTKVERCETISNGIFHQIAETQRSVESLQEAGTLRQLSCGDCGAPSLRGSEWGTVPGSFPPDRMFLGPVGMGSPRRSIIPDRSWPRQRWPGTCPESLFPDLAPSFEQLIKREKPCEYFSTVNSAKLLNVHLHYMHKRIDKHVHTRSWESRGRASLRSCTQPGKTALSSELLCRVLCRCQRFSTTESATY